MSKDKIHTKVQTKQKVPGISLPINTFSLMLFKIFNSHFDFLTSSFVVLAHPGQILQDFGNKRRWSLSNLKLKNFIDRMPCVLYFYIPSKIMVTNHFGRVQLVLVGSKKFWTGPKCKN